MVTSFDQTGPKVDKYACGWDLESLSALRRSQLWTLTEENWSASIALSVFFLFLLAINNVLISKTRMPVHSFKRPVHFLREHLERNSHVIVKRKLFL